MILWNFIKKRNEFRCPELFVESYMCFLQLVHLKYSIYRLLCCSSERHISKCWELEIMNISYGLDHSIFMKSVYDSQNVAVLTNFSSSSFRLHVKLLWLLHRSIDCDANHTHIPTVLHSLSVRTITNNKKGNLLNKSLFEMRTNVLTFTWFNNTTHHWAIPTTK